MDTPAWAWARAPLMVERQDREGVAQPRKHGQCFSQRAMQHRHDSQVRATVQRDNPDLVIDARQRGGPRDEGGDHSRRRQMAHEVSLAVGAHRSRQRAPAAAAGPAVLQIKKHPER